MSESDAFILSRRRFVLSGLLGMVAGGGLAGCALPFDATTRTARSGHRLLKLGSDPDSARRFGNAYLQDFPAERDLGLLLAEIDATLREHQGIGLDATGPQPLRARLDRQVRDEYRNAQVVAVEGWLLSRSEARLYAAITLL